MKCYATLPQVVRKMCDECDYWDLTIAAGSNPNTGGASVSFILRLCSNINIINRFLTYLERRKHGGCFIKTSGDIRSLHK